MARGSSMFLCERCQQKFRFTRAERRNHCRTCTNTTLNVNYWTTNQNKKRKKVMVTVYRQEDGFFHCLRCTTSLEDTGLFRDHTNSCKLGTKGLPPGPSFVPEMAPPLPPPAPVTPTVRFALPASPSLLAFTPSPSPPSLGSLSPLSTTPWLPTSGSLGFDPNHPIFPAPLAPPMSPLPMAVQVVGLPLLEALDNLSMTCPLCWLRELDNQHNTYICPNSIPSKLATSSDSMYKDFKRLIVCPPDARYCDGCFLPVNFTIRMESGQNERFHGKGTGRKWCDFVDALLPVLYYFYYQGQLRRMLNQYGILGYDFSTISQAEFTRWLVTPAPKDHLPPPLLVLHTMIGAFGMPPPPVFDDD